MALCHFLAFFQLLNHLTDRADFWYVCVFGLLIFLVIVGCDRLIIYRVIHLLQILDIPLKVKQKLQNIYMYILGGCLFINTVHC